MRRKLNLPLRNLKNLSQRGDNLVSNFSGSLDMFLFWFVVLKLRFFEFEVLRVKGV